MSNTRVKRGLEDLLSENLIPDLEKEEVIEIPIDLIQANPYQPRKHFDSEAMQELADSIRINGVLQPIIVKKISGGYMLVAGERRTKATKMAGFDTVPAIVRDYNNQYLAELALLENIQREDLTIVEEAQAYQNAIETMKLTHLELAQKIGKSRSYVSNTLGILALPHEILDDINQGNISMGHARALSKLQDVSRIQKIASMIIQNKLTVREIEMIVKIEKKKKPVQRHNPDEELIKKLQDFKREIETSFLDKDAVKIRSNQLTIRFRDADELEKFIQKMQGDRS
ncbi:MAG: ParB/RepB/Spo0J family partition protein [Candidatus Izemoplasmatales bacterium]|jgi:ParB family chromosome partitioning protein